MKSLGKLIDILKAHKVDKLKFSFPEPVSKEDFLLVTPDIINAAYFVKKALDYGMKNNLKMGFDGFPLCTMRGYEHLLDNLKTNDINFITECFENGFFPSDSGNKMKFQECSGCQKRNKCEGLYKLYHDLRTKENSIREFMDNIR